MFLIFKAKMVLIDDLPDEILIEILQMFHPQEWSSSFKFVCHRWNELVKLLFSKLSSLTYHGKEEKFYFECPTSGQTFFIDIANNHSDCCQFSQVNLIRQIIGHCGDNLTSVSLDVSNNRISFLESLVGHIGKYCRHLIQLNLSGSIILIIKSLDCLRPNLWNLEDLSVCEETFVGKEVALDDGNLVSIPRTSNASETTANFVEYLLSNCSQLRNIGVTFPFFRAPGAACFQHIAKLQLEIFAWQLYKPYNVDYIESMLEAIGQCDPNTLESLRIFSKIESPLNDKKMKTFAEKMCQMPNLKHLYIGFQLKTRSQLNNVLPVEVANMWEYFDTIDEAPWSESFFAGFAQGLPNLEYLNMRYFDLNFCKIAEYLQNSLLNLSNLNFDYNYNLNDTFLQQCFSRVMPKLEKLQIKTAHLSHTVFSHIISNFCPNLQHLDLSNVNGLSFKNLVLSLHSALHRCGCSVANNQTVHALVVELGTSIGVDTDFTEANELKDVNLCGLAPLKMCCYSSMKIDRVCCK